MYDRSGQNAGGAAPAAPGPGGDGPGGFGGGPPRFGGGGGGGGGGGARGGPPDARSTEPRVNRRIRVREVRVIADDGAQLGILPTDEALRRAEEKGLDLVEVQPMARPPVCKIMDYGKFKYQQKRKAAETKKNATVIEVKEVKFRPKTGIHDFDTKVRHLRDFLQEGNKSKVTIMFRGREIVHPEIGQDVLKRVAEAIADIGQVEMMPRMEGRQMFMIVAPGKASPKKAAPTFQTTAQPLPPTPGAIAAAAKAGAAAAAGPTPSPTGPVTARPGTGPAFARPGTGPVTARPAAGPTAASPAAAPATSSSTTGTAPAPASSTQTPKP